jgi:hypothetical protein
MTIGALGYLVAFGDMNLLSARVTVEVARLLSAFTGPGGCPELTPRQQRPIRKTRCDLSMAVIPSL